MIKYAIGAIFSMALLSAVPVQSASLSPASAAFQAASGSAVQKVHHCRRWSGGWGCRRHRW